MIERFSSRHVGDDALLRHFHTEATQQLMSMPGTTVGVCIKHSQPVSHYIGMIRAEGIRRHPDQQHKHTGRPQGTMQNMLSFGVSGRERAVGGSEVIPAACGTEGPDGIALRIRRDKLGNKRSANYGDRCAEMRAIHLGSVHCHRHISSVPSRNRATRGEHIIRTRKIGVEKEKKAYHTADSGALACLTNPMALWGGWQL